MKITYKQYVFIYCIALFALATGLMIAFNLGKQKQLKMELFKSQQIVYTRMVAHYIAENRLDDGNIQQIKAITAYFPSNLHLSVINKDGHLLFDNPPSERTAKEIAHYIRQGDYMIRSAIPYNRHFLSFTKSDLFFVILALFLFLFVIVNFVIFFRKYLESVKNLKYYMVYFRSNKYFPSATSFRDEDLREIQSIIREICNQMQQHEKQIAMEREKLIGHFHYAEEGISFFTAGWENIYTNSHFIQHLNMLLNVTTFDVTILFKNELFSDVVHFLENPHGKNTYSARLHANGRSFLVQVIIFDDKSFEIILRDITEIEKSNFDKSEMTNNIAHELLTPVTSMRGYFETLIEYEELPPEKKRDYIQRAYRQIIRLTDIIQDTVLLSKIGNASRYFSKEEINLYDLLRDMIEIDLKDRIEQQGDHVDLLVGKQVKVRGNRTLLYSIFRNLSDNVLKYAGENVRITIHNYMKDDDFYYFLFADNGTGTDEKLLDRIFERFYRVNEGRTRDKGGSGLGLSIVKDAVTFHHGEIQARNRKEGGLEFLFTLKKY